MKAHITRGKGERALDCPHYESCLDFAAIQNWKSYNCESCPFFKSEVKEMPTKPEKKENTRICEDCHKKTTISPGNPYCASCMAIRSHKTRPTKNKGPVKLKKKDTSKDKAEPQKPQQDRNTALTISFKRYVSVLKEIESLAAKEVRTVDLQVIYILKKFLASADINKKP